MTADELIRAGKIDEAIAAASDAVRKNPAKANLRVLLFQLHCIAGNWDRALTQLNIAADLDPLNLLMAQVCRLALTCEALRAEIFAGKNTPMVLGRPPEWLGQIIQANALNAAGKAGAAQDLRDKAFEAAPAVSGKVNGEPFAWIADADPRLGPVAEAMVDGKYYWIPFANIREINLEKPVDLRDIVWISANFTWINGGTSVGLLPVRYVGSEKSGDPAIRMSRKTDWRTDGPLSVGLGQREFATDQNNYAILEIRNITLDSPEDAEPMSEQEAREATENG